MGPVGGFEDGELLGGEGEGLFGGAFFGDEDFGRRHDVVGEEEVGEVAELAEGFDAGLDERGDLLEVGVAEDGLAQGCVELFGGEGADVFAVEPLEFGEVEDGAAEADVFDVEVGDHVGEGEDVGLAGLCCGWLRCVGGGAFCVWCGHAAAHEAEEVDDGFGEEAGLAVVDEGDGVFALGDFGFVEVAQEGHVPEAGDLPAEGFVEQDVLGGGGDPLFGADDVGDVHEVVVDDVGEVVGGEAVGLHEDLVVDVGVLEGDVAAELVAEGGGGGVACAAGPSCG